jgi:orotidine-5'-phosphate decarboxylase
MSGRFIDRMDKILERHRSLLCVGLDPDPDRLPRSLKARTSGRAVGRFLDGIVAATSPFAAAYKMQLAHYLRYGPEGIELLARLTHRIGSSHLRILDLKANDIANTMRMYHEAAFAGLGFDAVTVTPWLGWDTLAPFLEDERHGFFVIAHSSNPGAPDFQEIPTPRGPLWHAVVAEAKELADRHGNAGVVIGATFAEAVKAARQTLGDSVPILVPGVGAQGGDLATSVRDGVDSNGRALLINASRSIVYASSGQDWKAAAGQEASRLRIEINQQRSSLGRR